MDLSELSPYRHLPFLRKPEQSAKHCHLPTHSMIVDGHIIPAHFDFQLTSS